MKLIVDTGKKQDLSASQVQLYDNKLRSKISGLVSWSYSPVTGELVLDLGDAKDVELSQIVESLKTASEATRIIRLELFGMLREWEG